MNHLPKSRVFLTKHKTTKKKKVPTCIAGTEVLLTQIKFNREGDRQVLHVATNISNRYMQRGGSPALGSHFNRLRTSGTTLHPECSGSSS